MSKIPPVAKDPDPLEIPGFNLTSGENAGDRYITLKQDGLLVAAIHRRVNGNVELFVNGGEDHIVQRREHDSDSYSLMFVKRKQSGNFFPFMKLPGEVRNRIFDLLVGPVSRELVIYQDWDGHGQYAIGKYVEIIHPAVPYFSHCICSSTTTGSRTSKTSILQVPNKQLHLEFASRLFQVQTFSFNKMNLALKFLEQCGDLRAFITSLTLNWYKADDMERPPVDPEHLARQIVACTALKTLKLKFRSHECLAKTVRGFLSSYRGINVLLEIRGLEHLEMIKLRTGQKQSPVPQVVLDHFKKIMVLPNVQASKPQGSKNDPVHAQEIAVSHSSQSRLAQNGPLHHTAPPLPAPRVWHPMRSNPISLDLQAYPQFQNIVSGDSPNSRQQLAPVPTLHGHQNLGINYSNSMASNPHPDKAAYNSTRNTFNTASSTPNTGATDSQPVQTSNSQAYNATHPTGVQQSTPVSRLPDNPLDFSLDALLMPEDWDAPAPA